MFPEGEDESQKVQGSSGSQVHSETSTNVDDTPFVVVLLVASIIEVIAAGRVCDQTGVDCEQELLFAVLVGVFSIVFCVAYLLYSRFVPVMSSLVCQLFAFFFLCLWISGAGVTTFKKPFTFVQNGYFASWLACIMSCYIAYLRIPLLSNLVGKFKARGDSSQDYFVIVLLLGASVVELIAAITECDETGNDCKDEAGWAVTVGVVTTALTTIVLLFSAVLAPFKLYFAVLLAAIWIPGCGILTFDYAPFIIAGNGYFACWVAFFAALYWAYLEIVEKFPQFKPASATTTSA